MGLFEKLFGTKQDKDIKALWPLVHQVNDQESWAKGLKDEDFPAQTAFFREELANGKTLDGLLPKAFALAREASYRVLGQRQFDVQIMGIFIISCLVTRTCQGKQIILSVLATGEMQNFRIFR